MAVLMAAGSVAAVLVLFRRVATSRQAVGEITSIQRHDALQVLALDIQLKGHWPGHASGQFAFVTLHEDEGPHPFTISSAWAGDGRIQFIIKALGDYTRTLKTRLAVGQTVTVEGPYGRFDMARQDSGARQIWIAGGIGVTPFLAWLDSLRQTPNQVAADLHYCTRDRSNDPFVARLEENCAALPGIRLHIHGSRQGETLSAADVFAPENGSRRAEIWFCGPQGLAEKLKHEFGRIGQRRFRFHQEAFEMR